MNRKLAAVLDEWEAHAPFAKLPHQPPAGSAGGFLPRLGLRIDDPRFTVYDSSFGSGLGANRGAWTKS